MYNIYIYIYIEREREIERCVCIYYNIIYYTITYILIPIFPKGGQEVAKWVVMPPPREPGAGQYQY